MPRLRKGVQARLWSLQGVFLLLSRVQRQTRGHSSQDLFRQDQQGSQLCSNPFGRGHFGHEVRCARHVQRGGDC